MCNSSQCFIVFGFVLKRCSILLGCQQSQTTELCNVFHSCSARPFSFFVRECFSQKIRFHFIFTHKDRKELRCFNAGCLGLAWQMSIMRWLPLGSSVLNAFKYLWFVAKGTSTLKKQKKRTCRRAVVVVQPKLFYIFRVRLWQCSSTAF